MKLLKIFLTLIIFLFIFVIPKVAFAHDYAIPLKATNLDDAKKEAEPLTCAHSQGHDHEKGSVYSNTRPNHTQAYFLACNQVASTTPNNPAVGNITPPESIPTTGSDPSVFVAGLIRGVISLLIITAFVIALFWTMFAGYRLIFSGSDPKTVGAAWAQIYWGLLGLVIVVGSFAIIKLVETFFAINIISGGFQLPTR